MPWVRMADAISFNNGARVRLTDDGLKADGPVEKVYDGWPIPDDWVIEAPASKAPRCCAMGHGFTLFGPWRHRRSPYQPYGDRRTARARSTAPGKLSPQSHRPYSPAAPSHGGRAAMPRPCRGRRGTGGWPIMPMKTAIARWVARCC
jgi:hypothetical protein